MKLIILCKRRPQQRCLAKRPYGRFYHLPVELAKLGHEVHVVLIGHAGDKHETYVREGVNWSTLDIRTSGPFKLLEDIHEIGKLHKPDLVMGFSDAWAGCLAHNIASKLGTRLAIDAYDDYEAYMPWNLPLHWGWRKAIGAADLTVAAGPQLAALLNRHRPDRLPTQIVPMAADPQFVPMSRIECRQAMGLPQDAPIIGYSGAWGAKRGTDTLIKAYNIIRKTRPDVLLAVTGHPPKALRGQTGIHALGYLEDAQMPAFLNALNVSSVITTDSRFGKSSYPSKLCEALACDVPVVATATEPVKWMLRNNTGALVNIDDSHALATALLITLNQSRKMTSQLQSSWQQQAVLLHNYLEQLSP